MNSTIDTRNETRNFVDALPNWARRRHESDRLVRATRTIARVEAPMPQASDDDLPAWALQSHHSDLLVD